MVVFHAFQIIQMIPNCAKHQIWIKWTQQTYQYSKLQTKTIKKCTEFGYEWVHGWHEGIYISLRDVAQNSIFITSYYIYFKLYAKILHPSFSPTIYEYFKSVFSVT